MSGGNNGQPSNRHACAACKHQRRRCASNCIMAKFFPPDKAQEFLAAHKIFGIGNMTKVLNKVDSVEDRGKAVESLVWEGLAWKQDQVEGPLGLFRKLEKENELLKNLVNQQQIVPYMTELGLIGFNHSNINNANEVTIASDTIELDSQVNSYTNLLRGEEAKSNGVDCIATPYNYDIPQGQQGSVSQGRGILIGQPRGQGVSYPPLIQGQQRASQGRGQANIYNNVPHHRGARALHGTGRVMVQPNFGEAQQRILSPGGDGNAASYSNQVPMQTRVVQTRYAPYQVQRQERGQGINGHSFQQRTMNTNQNYTTQDQFDQVTYEDNEGFNFGKKLS